MPLTEEAQLKRDFANFYGGEARVFRAPGRVNLIGEHTDYNDGMVMPAAVDLYTRVAIAPRADRRIAIRSDDFSESREFDLDDRNARPSAHWSDYCRGVAIEIERAGYRLSGANILIRSQVPMGAGLGSSGAFQIACGFALAEVSEAKIELIDLAKLCQRAENEFIGTQCGIMDQFISCLGRACFALMIDCRSLDYREVPLSSEAKIVICNSMVKHQLATGEYNTRRRECEAGVKFFAERLPRISALRDVEMKDLERLGGDLPEAIFKRCRHVIGENARVVKSAEALSGGDLSAFGRLMAASHSSLRDDYEVSCRELDALVEIAASIEGVYGARMTGGGFGGCAINLVSVDSVEKFIRRMRQGYLEATGIEADIYICEASDGVREADG
jgi:galactokinase